MNCNVTFYRYAYTFEQEKLKRRSIEAGKAYALAKVRLQENGTEHLLQQLQQQTQQNKTTKGNDN